MIEFKPINDDLTGRRMTEIWSGDKVMGHIIAEPNGFRVISPYLENSARGMIVTLVQDTPSLRVVFIDGPDIVRPKIGTFMSDDEIVDDIVKSLSDESTPEKKDLSEDARAMWMASDYDELIRWHNTAGQRIRNMYEMWHEANPYSVINPGLDSNGIVSHPSFPDQRSQRIIKRVWATLREKYPPLNPHARSYWRRKVGLPQ